MFSDKIYFLCKYIKKTRMLSILIPTYNYDTTLLVDELHRQCVLENISFEILVGDDCSTNKTIIDLNTKINTFENCNYFINKSNLGRGNNINSLVEKSQYNWLLLLDCDVIPKENDFINKYINCIKINELPVHFGGISYYKTKPNDDEMLRWIYGNKRETPKLIQRKLNPYSTCLTSNILLKKEILLQFPFHKEIKNYGYEDLVLILNLRDNNIKINHIENEVYHLNLENSLIFIKKFESSLTNLKFLINNKIINYQDSKYSNLYYNLEKIKITRLISFGFKLFKNLFIKNLTSKKPSIYIFDLYRLGFYCSINSKK